MMTNAQPTGYIRRSVASRADPGDVSREFQTEEVRRLAGDDASRLVIIDRDWGRSAATDKTDRRLAFLALLDSIEAGDVSALYAYSTDRLARSVEWSARLLNACRRAGVPIVTREGRIEPGDAAAALLFNVLAAVNENALSGMEAKARATVARRKARNVEAGREPNAGLGGKPYGPEVTAAVLAAYDAAGSFLGACKLLKAQAGTEVRSHRGNLIGTGMGVPSRLGGRPNPRQNGGTYGWNFRTVGRIVRRERPDVPKVGRQGATARPRRRFSGLLVCPCGQILAPNGTANYTCRQAHNDASHSRPYTVSERKLLPWIRDEIAHLRPIDPATGEPVDAVTLAADNAAQRDALAGRLERANDLFVIGPKAGGWTRERRDAEAATVATELDRLGDAEAVVAVPTIDWTWDPRSVNAVLRTILDRVNLGPDLRPLPYPEGFVWTMPEWRAD